MHAVQETLGVQSIASHNTLTSQSHEACNRTTPGTLLSRSCFYVCHMSLRSFLTPSGCSCAATVVAISGVHPLLAGSAGHEGRLRLLGRHPAAAAAHPDAVAPRLAERVQGPNHPGRVREWSTPWSARIIGSVCESLQRHLHAKSVEAACMRNHTATTRQSGRQMIGRQADRTAAYVGTASFSSST